MNAVNSSIAIASFVFSFFMMFGNDHLWFDYHFDS